MASPWGPGVRTPVFMTELQVYCPPSEPAPQPDLCLFLNLIQMNPCAQCSEEDSFTVQASGIPVKLSLRFLWSGVSVSERLCCVPCAGLLGVKMLGAIYMSLFEGHMFWFLLGKCLRIGGVVFLFS